MRKFRICAAAVAAAAAACSRPAAPEPDAALAQDLAAAQAHADAPAPRTQFVSAVELGREPEAPTAAPRRGRRVPRAAMRSVTRERVAVPVRRTAPEAAKTPAPAEDVAEVEAPPAERPVVDEAPARDEPIVAAPSRRPTPAPGRRGRVWDMGDVIRNAPFPINPMRASR